MLTSRAFLSSPQAEIAAMPDVAVSGEFGEIDLDHQFGAHPSRIPRDDLAGTSANGRCLAGGERAFQRVEVRRVKARADAAAVAQIVAFPCAPSSSEAKGRPPCPRASSRRRRTPAAACISP